LTQILNYIDKTQADPNRIPPEGYDSFEKFDWKSESLKEAIKLELKERNEVDDVISFF